MPRDQLQLSPQGRQQAALFGGAPPAGRLKADGFVSYYNGKVGSVTFPTVDGAGTAPPADPAATAATPGGTGYRQPRAVAGQFVNYYQRVAAGEPVPQVGYNKPRTAPLPQVAPARFSE